VKTAALVPFLLAGSVALALGAGAAHAASTTALRHAAFAPADVGSQTSSNWAGYAVTDNGVAAQTGATPTTFSNVSGSWTQPAAACTRGSAASYSAFWVGLGGFADGSQALEQTGTEANCTTTGKASYSVWYELVPAAPVTVKLKVAAGDSISASVGVTGQTVSIRIANATRNTVFTKTPTMTSPSPDLSSAEWVAEAPSTCGGYSGCRPLPLANFGTATFTSATATGNGYTGTIGDPAWAATAVSLQGTSGGLFRGRFASTLPTADATPGPLSSDGSSFSVTWAQDTSTPAVQPGFASPSGRQWGR
jgi:peptidase A4-like protein